MPRKDALLVWAMGLDNRWHLYEEDAVCAAPLGPDRITTDQLPEQPQFCSTCRADALRRLDEAA